MRVIAALAFLVCLPPACVAGEWLTVNQAGYEVFNRKQWTEALAAFETAWPLAKTPIEKAITANDMGASLNALMRGSEAVPWYEQAFALWKAQPGHTEDLAVTSLGLIDVYRHVGRFAEAEQITRSMLPLDLPGERKAALVNTLGDILREQSRNQEARAAFESALALSGISPTSRMEAYIGLADIERGLGNGTAALEKARQAAALAREERSDHFEALALRIEGLTWFDAADFAKAEPILRRSLAIFEKQVPPPPHQVGAGYSCLAQLYREQRKFSLSEEAWLRALSLERKYSGDGHPQAAVIMESLAGVYSLQKRHKEAAELASAAWDIMSGAFGADSMPAAGAMATIGVVQQAEKHLEAAASSYAKALAVMRARGAPSDQNVLDVMDRYAMVLASLHRNDEAKQLRHEIKAFRFSAGNK